MRRITADTILVLSEMGIHTCEVEDRINGLARLICVRISYCFLFLLLYIFAVLFFNRFLVQFTFFVLRIRR